jgi:hypothetical protein
MPDQIEIEYVEPIEITEREHRLAEMGISPRRWMSRKEFEERFGVIADA